MIFTQYPYREGHLTRKTDNIDSSIPLNNMQFVRVYQTGGLTEHEISFIADLRRTDNSSGFSMATKTFNKYICSA